MDDKCYTLKEIDEFFNLEALRKEGYGYVLLYYYDQVIFKSIDQLDEMRQEGIMEGWIFNREKELHLFNYQDELRVVEFKADSKEKLISEDSYFIEERFLKNFMGKTRIVKEKYYRLDNDNQAVLMHEKLCDVV